jgi:acylphosphatase
MKKAVKIIIKGTVQGVFFRQFIKEHADSLKLRGFCRNIENNDVEIIAEGEGEDIKRFIKLVGKGPEHSQIRHVGIEERQWSGDFDEFKILRF